VRIAACTSNIVWYPRSVIDSGARSFCGGQMYFRQLKELTVTVSTARTITDEDWVAYLEGTLAIAKGFGLAANVSLLCCVHAYPNARQRQMASDFMTRHYIRDMERVAVITESVVIRGAMTAFSWIMPKVRVRAFDTNETRDAFRWLREVGSFDEALALEAWHEAKVRLSIRTSSLFPSSPGPGTRP
jgi:SpoIIAA-like